MEIFGWIVLGAIIWQGIIFIGLIITDVSTIIDEDEVFAVGLGVWWIGVIVLRFYHTQKQKRNKK